MKSADSGIFSIYIFEIKRTSIVTSSYKAHVIVYWNVICLLNN